MVSFFKAKDLQSIAYMLIESIHQYSTYRNEGNKIKLENYYKMFIYICGDLIGENLNAKYSETPTSIINRDTTIQWVIGLTKAIREENNEQIDSCARSLVQIMKGNLDV